MLEIQLNKTLMSAQGTMTLEVDTVIEPGKITTLFGESGAGKTSVLRMLAGLLKPDGGNIVVHGKVWYNAAQKIALQPQQRSIGYVFQDYALFPNMTVRQNLEFAFASKKIARQHQTQIDQLMELVALQALQHRKPHTLSGGQCQRVALARALVTQPDLLLLDEPLSALDQTMRQRLQDYLLQLHQKFSPTILLVSHDVGEIFKVSHQVLVLEHGRITQKGTPRQVFAQQQISGKFQVVGKVLDIVTEGVVYIVSVLAGNEVIKVVADASDITQLNPGDEVLVVSKAFNPLIKSIVGS
ncbi:ATP-binding cassette domain-containing protein [Microscilla marina]|uniref:Molybdenum transport ATP-binding protein n=1 Tax=Microscilla marina ATCC 23134 TaxID=313606 RepID=A1ZPQ0_MICM2|nr:ATP-binding cassette domain-containing protein [Microscilla marina]EAY27555.1 molybdenum transport ATP-binding protein [Microscilla marina ATCC 23134]